MSCCIKVFGFAGNGLLLTVCPSAASALWLVYQASVVGEDISGNIEIEDAGNGRNRSLTNVGAGMMKWVVSAEASSSIK